MPASRASEKLSMLSYLINDTTEHPNRLERGRALENKSCIGIEYLHDNENSRENIIALVDKLQEVGLIAKNSDFNKDRFRDMDKFGNFSFGNVMILTDVSGSIRFYISPPADFGETGVLEKLQIAQDILMQDILRVEESGKPLSRAKIINTLGYNCWRVIGTWADDIEQAMADKIVNYLMKEIKETFPDSTPTPIKSDVIKGMESEISIVFDCSPQDLEKDNLKRHLIKVFGDHFFMKENNIKDGILRVNITVKGNLKQLANNIGYGNAIS